MKKKISILILLFSFVASGQKKDLIIANYSYYNLGLKEYANVKVQILGEKSLSVFNRVDSIKSNTYIDDSGVGRFERIPDDKIGKKVYKNLTENKLIFRDFATKNGKFSPYIVEESIPILKWELIPVNKNIGKFNCKKAILKFRGRNYIAWYTPQIPTVHGPWKFHGLPGLIIQLQSKDQNIQFSLNSIFSVSTNLSKLQIPKNGEEITFEEYVKYKNNSTDEFLKKLYAKLPRGAKITVNSITNHNLEKKFN